MGGAGIGDEGIKDTLGIVASLTNLLLSEGSLSLLLLSLEILPVLTGSCEPFVDNLGVIAVSDHFLRKSGSELIHGALELGRLVVLVVVIVVHRLNVGTGRPGVGISAIDLAASVSAVLEDARGIEDHSVALCAAVHLNGEAELVEVESLRFSFSLGNSLSHVLLELGVQLSEGISADVGVVKDIVDDLLRGLDFHLVVLPGELLSPVEEIVPGASNGFLVGSPGINPSLVDILLLLLLLIPPGISFWGIRSSEGKVDVEVIHKVIRESLVNIFFFSRWSRWSSNFELLGGNKGSNEGSGESLHLQDFNIQL